MDKSRLEALQDFAKQIGAEFEDYNRLNIALTHRSYLNENRDVEHPHNERLEFLGDAVLELIISEHLFLNYMSHPEGDLTSFRAATVKTDTLAEVSRELGVGQLLLMSHGEESTGGRDKDYLLANSYESILGALYLDRGYEVCKKYVESNLIPRIKVIVDKRLDIDSKTKFQEVAQSLYRETPSYNLISAEGPDHEKTFTMAVMVGDREFGRGTGTSKQRAEDDAATQALEQLERYDKNSRKA